MHSSLATKPTLKEGLQKLLILVLLSACGSGGGAADSEEAQEPHKLPAPKHYTTKPKPLPTGEYVSDEFKPAMSFRLSKGWQNWAEGAGAQQEIVYAPEMSDNLLLNYAADGKVVGTVEFYADPSVYRMVTSYEAKVEPTPKDMVAWQQQNPRLEVEKPKPATVGGVKGEQFDAVVSRMPQEYLSCLGMEPSCLPLFVSSVNPDLYTILDETQKARFIVLEDVEGKTVVVLLTAETVKFDEFLPEAQEMLKTVEWKGA